MLMQQKAQVFELQNMVLVQVSVEYNSVLIFQVEKPLGRQDKFQSLLYLKLKKIWKKTP